jgi:diaminopimelate decarboxylase
VTAEELVAAHGSPSWLMNLEVLRDRWRTLSTTWREAWPEVEIAYSHKANRHPAVVGALAAEGAGHQVSSESEYAAARSVAAGHTVVVQGAAKSERLLALAARDDALVIADNARELDKAIAAGVRRLGLCVAQQSVGLGPGVHGVPLKDVAAIVLPRRRRGMRLEALAMHFDVFGFARRPSEARGMVGELLIAWPRPAEAYATATRALAALALRLDIHAVDVGGGFPPAPDEQVYARAVASAMGTVGYQGRLVVEPGRALVGEAVDLACTVLAEKRLQDGTRCVVVDAGIELVSGALYRWPRVDAPGAAPGETSPAMVVGPGCTYHDILHPRARLPLVAEGDVLIVRRVGAYNQSGSTEHGTRLARVLVRERDGWARWPEPAVSGAVAQ